MFELHNHFPSHESISILIAIESREYREYVVVVDSIPSRQHFQRTENSFPESYGKCDDKKVQFPMKNMTLLTFKLIKFLNFVDHAILDEFQSFALCSGLHGR